MSLAFQRVDASPAPARLTLDLRDAYAERRAQPPTAIPPSGRVTVRAIARETAPGAWQPTRCELVLTATPSGRLVFFGRARNSLGTRALADGRYRLRIESDHYQPTTVEATLGSDADALHVDLLPGYAYPSFRVGPFPIPGRPGDPPRFPSLIRGTVRTAAGVTADDHRVRARGPGGQTVEYRTDATGQWALPVEVEDGGAPWTFELEAPGSPPLSLETLHVDAGVTLPLPSRPIAGRVVDRRGRGVRGATVEVDDVGSFATGADGAWSAFVPDAWTGALKVRALSATGRPSRSQRIQLPARGPLRDEGLVFIELNPEGA